MKPQFKLRTIARSSKDGTRGHSLRWVCGFCKTARFRTWKLRFKHAKHCGK